MGRAFAGAVVLLWPERVVVGGGVADAGELLLAPVREELRRRACVAPVDGIAVVAGRAAAARRRAVGAALWAAEARGLPPRPRRRAAESGGVRGALGWRASGSSARRRARSGGVSVADGRIEGVGLAGAGTGIAAPGFVDVQVNGFAGVDFLAASPADYAAAAEALAATGVTAFLPTFISAPPRPTGQRCALSPRRRRAGRGGSAPTSRARSSPRPGRAPTRPSTCARPTSRWPTSCARSGR